MRTSVGALIPVLIVLASGVASAQPGQTPVTPQPYPPQPYPGPQQPYVPPPYGYAQQPMLTLAEHDLLADGEISDGAHIGGGVASLFVGFGVGQAIQGRWSDTGWIFTLGEVGALGMVIYGLSQDSCWGCTSSRDNDGEAIAVAGLIGFIGLHLWEIGDAFAGPVSHNRRVRALRMRLGYPPPSPYYGKLTPFVAPRGDDGGIAGVALRF